MKRFALIAAICIGGIALFLWTQRSQPETTPTHSVENANGKSGAPIVEVIVPTQFSENAKYGKVGFDKVCAACHGLNGAGKDGFGPPLVHQYYEPNHHGDQAFQMAVAQGVQAHHWSFGNMPKQEGLTRQDVQYIITYVRELQRANGIN